MPSAAVLSVPFTQMLAAVDRLDFQERELLHRRLVQREEEALVHQAKEVAERFNWPIISGHLSYWSVDKMLNELGHRLRGYEQKFGRNSKVFYRAFKRATEVGEPEEQEWAELYETYQRLKAAKRRVDLKAGRVVKPLLKGPVVSKPLTLAEITNRLTRFEQQAGLSSAQFYDEFKQGKQGDSAKTFQWVHAYTAYLTLSGHDSSEE